MKKVGLVVLAILLASAVFMGGYSFGKGKSAAVITDSAIATVPVVDSVQQMLGKQIEPLSEQEKTWRFIEKGRVNLLIDGKFYSADYHIQKFDGGGEPYLWYTVEKIRDCQLNKMYIQAFDFFGGRASIINLYGENLYFCAYSTAPNRGEMSIQVGNIKAEAKIGTETATQLLELADSIIQQLKP